MRRLLKFAIALAVPALPVPILVGLNDLEIVGTGGVAQPDITTLSI